MKKYIFPLSLLAFVPKLASAHCPLCTAGAGALAVLAASLGVSSVVVGILIGAFALALSSWISKLVTKRYIPYQKQIIAVAVFLGTIIPIMPLAQHYAPFYVSFIGEYGTTYTINLYIIGVVVGSLIMLVAPLVSKLVTKLRGERASFQKTLVTMALLIVVSVVIQFSS